MQIIIIPILFMFIGFMFLIIQEIMPIFQMLYFSWFGMIFACAASIYLIYRLHVSNTMKHADRPKKWKHLINYLRRDNTVVPIEGVRAYPGESFIDVKGLGLIEFLGKDCFYTWGDKKIIWGLENINYSPDPRYFNLNHLLWEIGFTDSVDIYNVLNGLDIELMGRVYMKMNEYDNTHGITKLVTEMKEYKGQPVKFKPSEDVHKNIDNMLNKVKRRK